MAFIDNGGGGNTLQCSTYKTVVVNFTAPAIPPANGYKVRWRAAGGEWVSVPNQFNNPITIAGVPSCFNLEVSIQADCGNGNLGNPVIAAVLGAGVTCYQYTLLESATYYYVPCNSQTEAQIVNNASTPSSICAVDGTVVGGTFSKTIQCSS